MEKTAWQQRSRCACLAMMKAASKGGGTMKAWPWASPEAAGACSARPLATLPDKENRPCRRGERTDYREQLLTLEWALTLAFEPQPASQLVQVAGIEVERTRCLGPVAAMLLQRGADAIALAGVDRLAQ